MHTFDITNTCPPFLHLIVTQIGSQFESGRAVACVNALLRLLLQWSSQKEVSYLQAGTVTVAHLKVSVRPTGLAVTDIHVP